MINFFSALQRRLEAGHRPVPERGAVFIPFDAHTSVGGPATFLGNLKDYLDQSGFPYVDRLSRASVILFPISYDLRELRRFKKRGGRICQRLDGIYYPEKHGQEALQRNAKIREIYLTLADHVVFQSEYSRIQCFDQFGPVDPSAFSIVVNGVNTGRFFPDADRVFNPRAIHLCTTGNFRNADMLVPVIDALDRVISLYPVVFHVIGPVRHAECATALQRSYVVHHEQCGLDEVASLLRQSDVFVYSHLNPPCPNSVLEAVASGLPVVGFDSGALAELLPFSTDLLADAGRRIYHRNEDFSPIALADKMVRLFENYAHYRSLSLKACKNYSMERCGEGYVRVLKKLQEFF